MADGIKLATRVYRPNDDQQYPILLGRTTYGSGAFGSKEEGGDYRELGLKMARKGYVVVVQDVRGLFASEGEWRLYKDDASDGYQTVIWLNEQKWSNGRVGAFGKSALGITASLLATTNPPGLQAAFVQMAPSDFYDELMAEGGIYRHEVITRWMYYINSKYASKLLQQGIINEEKYSEIVAGNEEFPELLLHTPLKAFPHLSENPLFPSLLEHYVQDNYFHYFDIPSQFSDIKIPIYHLGGWYDTFLEGTMKNYLGLQQNGGGAAKGNQKLLIGPWTHQDFGPDSIEGDNTFFEGDELDLLSEMERWFDYWLKDIDTGVMDEKPIKYFTLGANEWQTSTEWPVANMEEETLYLNGEKSNSAASINDATLTKKKLHTDAEHSFYYDPKNPIITIGGSNLFGEGIGLGPLDQRPAEQNSLTYTTEQLAAPIEIGGSVSVTLFVSSDAMDTDFTVNLTDVAPDGTSYLLKEGALRMRFREGLTKEVFMEKGSVYEITIHLNDVSHLFNEGHRIRLAVASSNFPRFDRNANTGNPLGEDSLEDFIVAENTVYVGPTYPSHMTLPVVKKLKSK